MKVFQIMKDEVLIINEDKQYSDTVEKFKTDSGLSLNNLNEVIYDNYQECCVVNKEFREYPNSEFNGYIDNIDTYIKAKAEREYVPPKEPTLEELKKDKLQQAGEVFANKRDAIRWVKVDGTHTYGFDCANDDITNFNAAFLGLSNDLNKSGKAFYKVWIEEDTKGVVALNLEQMSLVYNTVRNSQFEAYAWYERIKQQIEACPTKEGLDKIQIK